MLTQFSTSQHYWLKPRISNYSDELEPVEVIACHITTLLVDPRIANTEFDHRQQKIQKHNKNIMPVCEITK